MNQQTKFILASTVLPPDIQCKVNKLKDLGNTIVKHVEESEKNGKILRKSKELSIDARKAGNALYVKKGHNTEIHRETLKQYSQSIAFAPNDSEELSLGYSNRSSLLMHLHRYEESLVDIDRALNLSKSEELKKKLLTRKEKCLELINEKDVQPLTENLTGSNHQDLENVALKLMNFKPSDTVPCASDCVALAYNDTFGRHLVATRDIEPGEVLIVEEGYTCYPILSEIYLVCSHCLQIAWNGIPCDKCVFAIYCSEDCKTKAFKEYHDIECALVKYMECTLFKYEEDICDRLATIRLLIKAVRKEGPEQIMKEVFQAENKENLDALLSDGILQSDKFMAYYNLSHQVKETEKEKKREDLCTSVMVFLLIEHTDFFYMGLKNSISTIIMEPQLLLKVKEVLTKLKHITDINGFWFKSTPWQCGCNNISKCQQKCNLDRGVFMAPCCSLLNHSCTPNVSHMFAPKRKIIIFSTSPIKKGEQLCDTYGVTLVDGDLKERENRLRHFRFTCKCKACIDKVDNSIVSPIGKDDAAKIFMDFKSTYPEAQLDWFFSSSHEDWDISKEVFQYVIKMSQLYYKHFNYYEAFSRSYKCLAYIKKMMSKFYEEKSAVSNKC